MKPQHHPSQSWLLDYATGRLNNRFEALVRAHVTVCSECRDHVSFAESVGGELLAGLPAATNTSGDSDAALAICDSHEQLDHAEGQFSRAAHLGAVNDLEEIVTTYLNCSLDALPWRKLGQGLSLCRLSEQDGARMWLLRGEPGMVLPRHTHAGSELTLVLKGAYFCGSSIFSVGDIEDADESTRHQPMITHDGECICLAVTEGKLRFESWLPRLAQPFIGI